MNKRTLTALKGSIRKWEKIAAGKGVSRGADTCPLCWLFNTGEDFSVDCVGCPVMLKTGFRHCVGTPYWRFVGLANRHGRGRATTPAAKAAARRELAFLKSLLPKGKK